MTYEIAEAADLGNSEIAPSPFFSRTFALIIMNRCSMPFVALPDYAPDQLAGAVVPPCAGAVWGLAGVVPGVVAGGVVAGGVVVGGVVVAGAFCVGAGAFVLPLEFSSFLSLQAARPSRETSAIEATESRFTSVLLSQFGPSQGFRERAVPINPTIMAMKKDNSMVVDFTLSFAP